MRSPDRLAEMLDAQRGLQQDHMKVDFAFMTAEQRVRYVKDMVQAAVMELGEALDETTWKPWSSAPPTVHFEHLFGELIDVWHFLMNLFWAATAGPTSPEQLAQRLYEAYLVKREINVQRQESGYDGSGKCPTCERALDDVGVNFVHPFWVCRGCGDVLPDHVATRFGGAADLRLVHGGADSSSD